MSAPHMLLRSAFSMSAGCQQLSAVGKVPVIGILKRGGRVCTKMIPDARSEAPMPIIKGMIPPDSIVYTDTWASHTRSISRTFITGGSIIQNCSPTATTTSTAFTEVQRRAQTPLSSVPQRV